MFLTGISHLDLDLDMVTGLWYTHNPILGSLSWFWRCKEHPCPLSPHLGLWRTLEVPDRGLVSWCWFEYGYWSLIYLYSKFWLSFFILKVQRTSRSFQVLIWGFVGCWRFLTGVWHLDLDLVMVDGHWNTYIQNFGSLSWLWRCKEHPCPLSPDLGLWRMLDVPYLD